MKHKGIPCQGLYGEEYPSIRKLAQAYGISRTTFYSLKQAGFTDEEILKGKRNPQNYRRTKEKRKCIDYMGKEYDSLTALAKEYGLSRACLRGRLNSGWSIQDALTIPVNSGNHTSQFLKTYDHLGNEFKSKKEMCLHYGVPYKVFTQRYYMYGLSLEDSLTKPVAKQGTNWNKPCVGHLGNKDNTINEMVQKC